MILDPKLTGQLPEVISEGGYYGMQTFDQHLLQHLEAGRITMEEAVHVATSPHDFKLMVAAGGKPKGEGQAQGPGYKPADHSHPASEPGVATMSLKSCGEVATCTASSIVIRPASRCCSRCWSNVCIP